jgi:hypothetical protein
MLRACRSIASTFGFFDMPLHTPTVSGLRLDLHRQTDCPSTQQLMYSINEIVDMQEDPRSLRESGVF